MKKITKEELDAKRKSYYKEYYKKNKEKLDKQHKIYNEENKEKIAKKKKLYFKKYYEKNKHKKWGVKNDYKDE